MRIKIEKNYLSEDLDDYWKKKLDALNSNVDKLNDKQEAMRQVLSNWEKDTKKYEVSNDTKSLLSKYIKSILDSQDSSDLDYGEDKEKKQPSKDDILAAEKRIPKNKKDLFNFFLSLERLKEEDNAFYNAVSKCLNEMSANSLYWLCVDVKNAGYSDKQQVVDTALKDSDALVGGTTKRYIPARAFVLRSEFVNKYINLFKPFAGQRELPSDSTPTPVPTGSELKQNTKEGSVEGTDDTPKDNSEKTNGNKTEKDSDKVNGKKDDKTDDKADDKVFIYGSNQKKEDPKLYTAIRVMDGVSEIGNKAFQGMSNVEKIFWYVKKPEKVSGEKTLVRRYEGIPQSVVRINSYAFSDCKGIHRLVLPENIEYIGDMAFSGTGISSFSLGRKAKDISKNAFVGISSPQIILYISAMSPFYFYLQKSIQSGKIKNISDYFSNGNNIQVHITDVQKKKRFDKEVQRLTKKR